MMRWINLLFFLSLFFCGFSQVHTKEPFSIGERVLLHSEILNQDRFINIYLPNGYSADSAKTYPVIYLLDGSKNEDFIHIAGLVQFGSFSWINLIPETIVVGIENIDRKKDFTFPSKDPRDVEQFPTTGHSSEFIQFIEKELFEFIGLNYKINSENTLIGQSLGGLLATEILLKKTDLFKNYIIISPSLWWNKQSLLKEKLTSFLGQKSIYIGVGNEGMIMKKTAKKLYKKVKQSANDSTQVYFQYFKQQNHGDILHLAVYDAFKKVFSSN